MSDFLHNLIARNYGLKPVAQPRLAARFEPQPGSLWPTQGPTLAPESEAHTDSTAEPSATLASSRHRPDAEPSPGESLAKETEPETQTTRERGQPITRPLKTEWRPVDPAPTLNPASSASLDNEAFVESRARSVAQPQRTDMQASADREAHDPDNVRVRPASGFTVQMAAEFLLNERRQQLVREAGAQETNHSFSTTGAEREEPLAPGDERLATDASAHRRGEGEPARRAVLPVRTIAQPNASGERAASAASRSGVEAESLSPTIRVTIGRIDVRAVMPEAGAAPRRAAAPARPQHGPLSLEEYLKQRNGGRR